MNRDSIDNLLSELGEARSAGVFPVESSAVPNVFPWQTQRTSVQVRSVRWLRVAVPLAAAATLAFAFVGSGFRRNVGNVSPDPKSIATTLVAQGSSDPDDCNGDGRINGADIDCFVRQHTALSGSSELQTGDFTRRLLGI